MPLSYLIYTEPHLRPFSDIDLFIQTKDFKAAGQLMTSLGYEARNEAAGEFISYQRTFKRVDSFGVEHYYDIHQKISNPVIFSDLLIFEEAWSRSISVPRLDARARTLCPTHALLLACVHRVAHHAEDQRPIWFKDIHLLTESLSQDEFDSFLKIAEDKKVLKICVEGVQLAKAKFETKFSEELFEKYRLKSENTQEASGSYLKSKYPRLRDLISNLKTISGFNHRVRFLKNYAFPDADYLLKKYSVSNRGWLPLLYFRRGMEGIWKIFRRT
jgi:hypothetical protein